MKVLPANCLMHNLHWKHNWLGQVCDCRWHFCHASYQMHSLSLCPGCLNTLGTLQGGQPLKGMPEEESHEADDCTDSVSGVHCHSSWVIERVEGRLLKQRCKCLRHHLPIWSVNKIQLLMWDFCEGIKVRVFFSPKLVCVLRANLSTFRKNP